MSQFYQSKPGKPGSKVVPLIAMPPDGWEQRTGWTLETNFGFMASGKAPADRLLRLADVLRWLQVEQALPRGEALQVLIAELPDDVMTWLYQLDAKKVQRAQPVPADATFGYKTAAQIDSDKAAYRQAALQRGLEQERSNIGGGWTFVNPTCLNDPPEWPEPTEPGRPALVKALGHWWSRPKLNRAATCDMLDEPRCSLSFLAVPIHKAFAVWGWGGAPALDAGTVAAPARVLVKDQKPEWTGKRIHERIGELEKLGRASPVAAVVAEVGLSDREVRRRRSEYLKALASPMGSMAAGLRGRNKTGT
jgi:hypothetical protein